MTSIPPFSTNQSSTKQVRDDEQFRMSLLVDQAISQLTNCNGETIHSEHFGRYSQYTTEHCGDRSLNHVEKDWHSPYFSSPSYAHTITKNGQNGKLEILSGDKYNDGIAVVKYSYYCENLKQWISQEQEFQLDKNPGKDTSQEAKRLASMLRPFIKKSCHRA